MPAPPGAPQMAFRYLSWILFPLLGCYAVYSLLYLEHKGWYSWVLSMLYGFLLTFGEQALAALGTPPRGRLSSTRSWLPCWASRGTRSSEPGPANAHGPVWERLIPRRGRPWVGGGGT